jgi:hypothetical protein
VSGADTPAPATGQTPWRAMLPGTCSSALQCSGSAATWEEPWCGLREREATSRAWQRSGVLARAPSGGQLRHVSRGSPVNFGNRVSIVPQRGRPAPAVAQSRCGVLQIEPCREQLAGRVVPQPL